MNQITCQRRIRFDAEGRVITLGGTPATRVSAQVFGRAAIAHETAPLESAAAKRFWRLCGSDSAFNAYLGHFLLLAKLAVRPPACVSIAVAGSVGRFGGDPDLWAGAYESYLDWAASLSPETFLSFVRAALALVLCMALCGLLFRRAIHRLPRGLLLALIWAGLLVGALLAMEVPLGHLDLGRVARGWVFLFSIFVLVVAPAGLTWLLAPIAGLRKWLMISIYAALGLAIIIGLWR